ncbi:F-box/WD repeat-containing protein 4-like [Diadema antillarum]|uniref:F-box/WD repeat-containing protein 4-like n=1 Tax=Diadema antillarum TaxID=105358 RepID=UPI003A84A85F
MTSEQSVNLAVSTMNGEVDNAPEEEPHILKLPTEVVICVLDLLPVADLAEVSGTCKQLWEICCDLAIWRKKGLEYINFDSHTSGDVTDGITSSLSLRDRCRIAHHWHHGKCSEHVSLRFKTKLLPWLQLTEDHLYISVMSDITKHRLKENKRLAIHHNAKNVVKFTGHSQDVNRFLVKHNDVISCSRDGQVLVWDKSSGARLVTTPSTRSAVMSVDATRTLLIGGTNNIGVRMWSRSDGRLVHHIRMDDRVWSVQLDPCDRLLAVGSSGNSDLNSLKLWDLESHKLSLVLGENKRKGAGILDLQFESPQSLLSAGYDTYIRQWDIRTPRVPTLEFEEPSDNVVYCLSSDNNNFIAAGSCRHGVVRFWDKRRSDTCLQTIYVGARSKSPVYSIQHNYHCLYVALANGIYILDFNQCMASISR